MEDKGSKAGGLEPQQQMTEQPDQQHSFTKSTSSLSNPRKLQYSQTANSPKASRDSSPIRPTPRNTSAVRSGGRSRKNSKEISPARSASGTNINPPSAAAVQRALSAANTPQLIPTDTPLRAPIPQKASITSEPRETPRWPISPRLKSPPPLVTSLTSPRKLEHDPPTIRPQRSTSGVTTPSESKKGELEEESPSSSGMRGQTRGVSASTSTLETVQETSQPTTPAIGNQDGSQEAADGGRLPKIREPENPIDSAFNASLKSKTPPAAHDSGNESSTGKSEVKMRSTTVPVTPVVRPNVAPAAKSSVSVFQAGRGKAGEGSTRNMTVETETVTSVPIVAIGGGAGGNNGSLRTKPSSETIRPKREKKRTTRKAPSASGMGEYPEHLHKYSYTSFSGRPFHHQHPSRPASRQSYHTELSENSEYDSPTKSDTTIGLGIQSDFWGRGLASNYLMGNRLTNAASSKADIFEAKVASAVDEADSSDSDETFVYESNPPDAADRPRNRFHSRTPSATSMVSQLNTRDGSRLDGVHSVALKKSMKFANSYNSNGNNEATAVDDDGKGTARSNMGGMNRTVHHHHVGRYGRRDGNGHPSLFDQESPFPNASRPSKFSGNNSRQSSRPTSPRFPHLFKGNGGRRSPMTVAYDPDETAADDERTPLILPSSVRSARSRGQRRTTGLRHHDRQNPEDEPHSVFGKNSSCWIFTIMLVIIGLVAAAFIFTTTEPLEEVEITALKNIVASEQELMFDLVVKARNPNVIGVAVDSLDMSVFAVTKQASEESSYAQRTSFHNRREKNSLVTVLDDSPFDPPRYDDEDPTAETTYLGSILVFDNPLQFDGFPWQHEHSTSTGAVTLSNPGSTTNRTVEWEKAIKHEFDLVVKGVLRYTLPLSTTVRKAQVSGRVDVHPQKAGKDKDKDEKNGTDDDGGPDKDDGKEGDGNSGQDSGVPLTGHKGEKHELKELLPVMPEKRDISSTSWFPRSWGRSRRIPSL